MSDYIDREAFVVEKRKQYCEDCTKRKGMKNGKLRFCYEIGEAPCRSCGIDDMLSDVEDFPAADVVEVVRCKDCVHYNNNRQLFDDDICEIMYYSDGIHRTVCERDYCSYGKRKEGEE